MSTAERIVVAMNVAMAAGAAVANYVSARYSYGGERPIRVAVGSLATLYVLAYAWLFTHPDQILAWSSLLRGVSILTWPIVWTAPALMHLARRRHVQRAIDASKEDPR